LLFFGLFNSLKRCLSNLHHRLLRSHIDELSFTLTSKDMSGCLVCLIRKKKVRARLPFPPCTRRLRCPMVAQCDRPGLASDCSPCRRLNIRCIRHPGKGVPPQFQASSKIYLFHRLRAVLTFHLSWLEPKFPIDHKATHSSSC
jgi:hypothetical protein